MDTTLAESISSFPVLPVQLSPFSGGQLQEVISQASTIWRRDRRLYQRPK